MLYNNSLQEQLYNLQSENAGCYTLEESICVKKTLVYKQSATFEFMTYYKSLLSFC